MMVELNPTIGNGTDLPSDGESKILLSKELMQAGVLHTLGENAVAVIHELRNPLQAISSYLQLLERKITALKLDQPLHYFDLLYAEIGRMDNLMEQFLRLTRLAPAEPKPLILADKVDEFLPLLSSLAKVRGVELDTEICQSGALCLCDEQQFKQLLLNLFANACDACENRPEPCVRVQLQVKGQEMVLDVVDNGCGIPADKLEKIWSPFYTSKNGGTGLGLPTCAQIASEHNGSLTAISVPDQGSCFTLRLPITKNK